MAPISIGGRKIGPGEPCLIVAEVSANHHQKYEEAEAIVRAAKEAGADAVKLQTYTPDTMTIDSDKKWFYLGGENTPASWKKDNLYKLYGTAYTPWEWQPKLKKLAESLGLIFFSTPFDATAVDFLEKMNVPCYKIASYEATDIPLLKKVASTGKPVIISIGFAELSEAEEALKTLRDSGTKDIAVLHCVTAYSDDPQPENMNLRTIRDIAERFGVVSGFSDNNAGIEVPIASVYAGASIIEKHLILDRKAGGPDARFSIEPAELKALVDGVRHAEKALGMVHYGPINDDEKNYKTLRRSIFAVADIAEGETFTEKNIRVIRPAYGLPPREYERALGKKASRPIERGEPLGHDSIG
ncbi:pseudaminic acid synthase [Candidatus Kaiserbacteria bacterium]|nr:pseudaminic acid synthase [Candidatus Kaiserbacteria bacterium]